MMHILLKNQRDEIKCLYLLLSSDSSNSNFFKDTISMVAYGSVDFRLISPEKENEEFATNGCVMIRYPYMKINTKNLYYSLLRYVYHRK